jgi:cytochrome c oxidase subunit 3
MLTGFHGFHVTIGAIMLLVIWLRTMKGHFTPQRHFAFEAWPGTGTSSTWSGSDCSCSSTGSDAATAHELVDS